jgi:hypothetical protein
MFSTVLLFEWRNGTYSKSAMPRCRVFPQPTTYLPYNPGRIDSLVVICMIVSPPLQTFIACISTYYPIDSESVS